MFSFGNEYTLQGLIIGPARYKELDYKQLVKPKLSVILTSTRGIPNDCDCFWMAKPFGNTTIIELLVAYRNCVHHKGLAP